MADVCTCGAAWPPAIALLAVHQVSRSDRSPPLLYLQVGTSDGRVVLIGRPGVEATLRSASRSPTQHLCFLPNRGALLRVTQDGDIQLFSAVQRRLLTSIWLQVRRPLGAQVRPAHHACVRPRPKTWCDPWPGHVHASGMAGSTRRSWQGSTQLAARLLRWVRFGRSAPRAQALTLGLCRATSSTLWPCCPAGRTHISCWAARAAACAS